MMNTPLPKEELSALVMTLRNHFLTITTALENRTTKYSPSMYKPKNLNHTVIGEEVKKVNDGIEESIRLLSHSAKLAR